MSTETQLNASGFTLLEVVIALFFVAIGVIATAPLFIFAAQENAANGDMGEVGAAAVRQMEVLRTTPYSQLSNGGSLSSNSAGYFDASDPDTLIRWTIIDNPDPPAFTKIITVRVVARDRVSGQPRRATLISVRGG